LKHDKKRGVWYVLNYTQSKEKVGHAIRDATITEESKKNRARRRKLQRAAAAMNSRKNNSSAPSSVKSGGKAMHSDLTKDSTDKEKCDQSPPSTSLKLALSARLKESSRLEDTTSSSHHDEEVDPFNERVEKALSPKKEKKTRRLELACANADLPEFDGVDPFIAYIDKVLGQTIGDF
jgi:hypothetical protein